MTERSLRSFLFQLTNCFFCLNLTCFCAIDKLQINHCLIDWLIQTFCCSLFLILIFQFFSFNFFFTRLNFQFYSMWCVTIFQFALAYSGYNLMLFKQKVLGLKILNQKILLTAKSRSISRKYSCQLIFWHHIKITLYRRFRTPIAENVVPKINIIVLGLRNYKILPIYMI